MKYCQKCESEYDDNVEFCMGCGGPLTTGEARPPTEARGGVRPPTEAKDVVKEVSRTMKCPDCGDVVSKRAATCPHCGTPLRLEASLQSTREIEKAADHIAHRMNEVAEMLSTNDGFVGLLNGIKRRLSFVIALLLILVILKGCDGTNDLLKGIKDNQEAPKIFRGEFKPY